MSNILDSILPAITNAASTAVNDAKGLLGFKIPQNSPVNNVSSAKIVPQLSTKPLDQSLPSMQQQTPMAANQQVAPSPTHAKTNGAISNSAAGQFAAGAASSAFGFGAPYDMDTAEKKFGANSPYVYGMDVGSAGGAFMGEGEVAPDMDAVEVQAKAKVNGAIDAVKPAIQDTINNAKAQPGGLQAGMIKPDEPLPSGTKITRDNRFKQGNFQSTKNPQTPPNAGEYEQPQAQQANPNAEQFNEQQQAKTPYTPHPNVPDEPELIENGETSSPVTLNMRDRAKKNPYYLEDQKKSQQVLDDYVPGRTAQEVEQNLNPKIAEESQRIENTMAQNPNKTVSASDIAQKNAENMAKAGINLEDTPISANSAQKNDYLTKAKQATTSLQSELEAQATAGKSSFNPTLDGPTIQKYISNLDDRLQSVYKKIDNGTTLTPSERATLTYRRTLRSTLSDLHPKADAAIKRQAAMIDARPYVADAASDEIKGAAKGGGITNKGILGTGLLASTPLDIYALNSITNGGVGKALNLAGGYALDKVQQAYDALMHKPNNGQVNDSVSKSSNNKYLGHGSIMTPFDTNVNSMSTLPATPQDIAVNADGTMGIANVYTWKDTKNNPLFVSNEDIKSDNDTLAGLQQQYAVNGSSVVEGQISALQTKIAAETQFSKAANDNWGNFKTATSLYNQATVDSQKAGLDISNYNGSYNDLLNQVSQKNTDLAQDLQNLKNAGLLGDQVSFTGTLTGALQMANAASLVKFYNMIGQQDPTAVGTGTATQIPTAQGTSNTNTTMNSPMPAITYPNPAQSGMIGGKINVSP